MERSSRRLRTRLAAALLGAAAWAGCAAPPDPGDGGPSESDRSEPLIRWRFRAAEKGPPVAGAAVRWTLDLRPARDPATAGRISGTGSTDSEGRFSMPAPVDAGYLAIWVSAAARWVLAEDGIFEPGGVGSVGWYADAEVALLPLDRCLRLRVLDPNGASVAGARMTLVVDDEGAPIPADMFLVSDARGEIRHGPMEYGNYWFDLEAPGFAPLRKATYQFPVDSAESEVQTVTLHPGVTLRGEVFPSGDGELPEGARASVAWTHPDKRDRCEWFVPLSPDGRFECIVPRGSEVTVTTGAPGRDHGVKRVRLVGETSQRERFALLPE